MSVHERNPYIDRAERADRALARDHARGLLSDAERRAFERRLAAEPALRMLYAQELRTRGGASPASAWAGLRRRGGRWRWAGWAAAGAALILVLILASPEMPGPPGPDLRADIRSVDGAYWITARFEPATGALVLTRMAGAPAPEGRVQRLWLIPPGMAPIPLGRMASDGAGLRRVLTEPQRALMPGATLAVSEAPVGATPVNGPRGPVLAAGVVTVS